MKAGMLTIVMGFISTPPIQPADDPLRIES